MLVVVASAMIGSTATASPIGAADAAKHGLVLTLEQVELLNGLPDNGLHLGWFKNGHGDLLDADLLLSDAFDSGRALIQKVTGSNAGDLGALADTLLLGAGNPVSQGLTTATNVSTPVTPVPEPATLVLLGSGLVAGVVRRRLREKRQRLSKNRGVVDRPA